MTMKAGATPEQFRKQFEVFNHLVYLASCTQGALSKQVEGAILEDLSLMHAEGVSWRHRGLKAEEARHAIAKLINAEVDEIALLPSATIAYYQILSAINQDKKRRVISTNLEFPSIGHVLQTADSTKHAIKFLVLPTATWDISQLNNELRSDVALVSIPHVCYSTGLTLPLAVIIEAAHSAGIEVVSDVYQSIGVIEIDVKKLNVDYLVGGTLKYALGIPGLGFAYVRSDKLIRLDPMLTGWQGRLNPGAFTISPVDFPTSARKLEIGTPSVLSNYAAASGIECLSVVGNTVIENHVRRLAIQLTYELLERDVKLLSPIEPELIGPMVVVFSEDPERLSAQLVSRQLVVGPRGRGVRISFHYYNTESDVRAIVDALLSIRDSDGML